jgi:phage shock protein C
MYCNACGKAIAEDGRFCAYCGNVVGFAPVTKRLMRPRSHKLMRPRSHKKIVGVCAGLAHYYDVDVTLVRILCIFLTLATGVCPGIATYLLAWIIIPSEPELKPLFASQQPVAS